MTQLILCGEVTVVPCNRVLHVMYCKGSKSCADTLFKGKQDRQCACNVILRRVHVTTVAVEKQYYISVFMGSNMCLRACILTYAACNAHEPHCLPPLWLHHVFRHYLIKVTIFGEKKLLNVKYAF
jgi:hypothetical protein